MNRIHEYLEWIKSQRYDPYHLHGGTSYPARYPTGNELSAEELKERQKERFVQFVDPERYYSNLDEIQRLEGQLTRPSAKVTIEASSGDEIVVKDDDGNVIDREEIQTVGISKSSDIEDREYPLHQVSAEEYEMFYGQIESTEDESQDDTEETIQWECEKCGKTNSKRILGGYGERRCPECLQITENSEG